MFPSENQISERIRALGTFVEVGKQPVLHVSGSGSNLIARGGELGEGGKGRKNVETKKMNRRGRLTRIDWLVGVSLAEE